jgi:hypothetical protein
LFYKVNSLAFYHRLSLASAHCFASRNEDRITTESAQMLSPSDLVQLPKGQAFALIHGGQLHKLRMPLPDASHDPLMPASLEAIGNEVRRRHDGHWRRLPLDAAPGEPGSGV